MICQNPILVLLISIVLCSCKDSAHVITVEDSRKLDAVGKIVTQIEKEHGIQCNPFVRVEDGAAQIEFNVTDPGSDYQSIVPKISKLKGVQSFDGEIELLFRIQRQSTDSDTDTDLEKYDAKTGKQIDP